MSDDLKDIQPRGLSFALIGPGLLVAATGVGAGDLAGGALAGAGLGLAILWAAPVGAALKFAVNEGLARFQLATGRTWLEGASSRFGTAFRVAFVLYLIPWIVITSSAILRACEVCAQALFGGPAWLIGLAHTLAGLALVWFGGFGWFSRLMTACIGLMFVAMLTAAALSSPDWLAVARGLIPSIPAATVTEPDPLGRTIALIGGVGGTLTIISYGYWMREERLDAAPNATTRIRLDLGVGYTVTALFAMATVVVASGVGASGKGAGLLVAMSEVLTERVGSLAGSVFLVGCWAAVFSSLLGVWQSTPYIVADTARVITRSPKAEVSTASPIYRATLIAVAAIPLLTSAVNFAAINKYYGIYGALFLPALAATLLWMNRSRNGALSIAMLVAAIALFVWFGFFV